MSKLTTESLQKLTVAQLKALCREKKITAYSKLQKKAIIEQLVSQHAHLTLQRDVRPQQKEASKSAHRLESNSKEQDTNKSVPLSDGIPSLQAELPDYTAIIIESYAPSLPSGPAFLPRPLTLGNTPTELGDTRSGLIPKHMWARKSPEVNLVLTSSPGAKRQKLEMIPVAPVYNANHSASLEPLNLYDPGKGQCQDSHSSRKLQLLGTSRMQTKVSQTRLRRFVPPAVVAGPVEPRQSQDVPAKSLDLAGRSSIQVDLSSLCFDENVLKPIGIPPSLSQRRLVKRFSLAFTLVSTSGLRALSFVSRLVRYAALQSALYRLQRLCPGERLNRLLLKHPAEIIDFWPYLKFREAERGLCEKVVTSSVLGGSSHGNRLSSCLLWNPDNQRQVGVAARFLLTHLYFAVSVGLLHRSSLVVVDAHEVIPEEVWMIETRSNPKRETYYVLEATCEVIGTRNDHHPENPSKLQKLQSLRADWFAYIEAHDQISSKGGVPTSLLSRLRWENYEEYSRGISRVWLKRMQAEGDLGTAKVCVAKRYVLACVVGNSLSGQWMSSTHMSQEFNGMPPKLDWSKLPARKVHLFLPAHHHVESVHFTTTKQQQLHPAIAVVQTSARMYYILRDNGMQIGCEEEGVASVWRAILGCTIEGVAKAELGNLSEASNYH